MIDPATVARFPLEWPAGWRRTPGPQRSWSRFSTNRTSNRRLTIALATTRLQHELDRLGAQAPTLSTNVALRLDGRPRSEGGPEPSDPGVAVYFSFRGRATVLACDRYGDVAGNIAAIAAHIDALRRIERYGVGTIEQALAGYKALPADSAADWRVVFGKVTSTGTTLQQLQQVEQEYRRLAQQYHPDITHDDGAKMAWLNRARDYARGELASGHAT
jgi:hypothetical protein